MQGQARRIVMEVAVAALGLGLMAGAAFATRGWFEHHFLEEFLHPRAGQLRGYWIARVGVAVAGLALALLVRPWAGRLARDRSFGQLFKAAAPTLVAVVAAVATAELILDALAIRPRELSPPLYEPRRVRDPVMGWRQLPDRTAWATKGGRRVRYDFDVYGYRVRERSRPTDLSAPTIVVAGESFIQGHGLFWDETMPAQLAAMTGLNTANVAVGGYATDQIYLLVKSELPKFREPVAVVVVFMPGLFHRNMDLDRPHLTAGLRWSPPKAQPKLAEIFGRLVEYRSDRQIADGVTATREQLRAIVALAHARGATAVIVDPQVGPENAEEREIRHRVLDEGRLPYVVANIREDWLLPQNRHPDARGARAMAAAVAGYLSTHDHHTSRPAAPAEVDAASAPAGSIGRAPG